MSGLQYECPISRCDIKCHTIQRLLGHMTRSHVETLIPFVCNMCHLINTTVVGFRMHVRRKHPDHWNQSGVSERTVSQNTNSTHESIADSMICDDDLPDESIERTDLINVFSILNHKLALFHLRHREEHLLPLTAIAGVMRDVGSIIGYFQDVVRNSLMSKSDVISTDSDLCVLLDSNGPLTEMFETFASNEYLKKYCLDNLNLVSPQTVFLGDVVRNGKCFKETLQYVPIASTLKAFIEHEDVYQEVMSSVNIQPPDSSVLRRFTDGTLFNDHALFKKGNVLRLHFYVDDFEVCNPIGSRKSLHKLTGVYFVLGNTHVRHWSSMRSVHLAMLVKTSYIKKHGFGKVFKPLVDDLKVLATDGLLIDFKNKVEVFQAAIATVSADNLASHQFGGFRECFSSGVLCRFCMTSFCDRTEVLSEDDCTLRTSSDHKRHVEEVVRNPLMTPTFGVKGPSPLLDVPYFDPIHCLPADAMHDVLEGLIPVNISVVLRGLIQHKYVNLKQFNETLIRYSFNDHDKCVIPPKIPEDFHRRGKVCGSATQTWCLFRSFPFVLHNCGVDVEKVAATELWRLHILCRKICAIILSGTVSIEMCELLVHYIRQHHTLLVELDAAWFTPKIHFLVHYPRLLIQFGPLRHLWCLRFEAKHQYFKKVARITGNFKNIALSLANRHQFQKCFLQSADMCLKSDIVVTGRQQELNFRSLPIQLQSVLSCVFSLSQFSTGSVFSSVQVESAAFAVNEFYVLDLLHEESIPLLINVTHILFVDGLHILCGFLYSASTFSNFHDAFEFQMVADYVAVTPMDLIDFHPITTAVIDSILYGSLPYAAMSSKQ